MNKVKVIHLSTVHQAFDTRIFHKECKSLYDSGYDVSLVVPHERDEVKENIKILSVQSSSNKFERMFVTSMRVFKRCLEAKGEIYHFHDSELIFVGLLLKLSGKKVIYDAHEDLPNQLIVKKWLHPIVRFPISKLAAAVEWVASRTYLDAVVTVTDKIAARFPKNSTILVQNFPRIYELSADHANDYKLRKNNFCFVGSLKKNYGIKEMIQALELLNGEAHLFLGGKFQYDSYRNELESMDGWKHVTFLGWVDRHEYKNILSKSIGGIVVCLPEPNIIEAQPNKLFEYMSASIPVVASDFPRWRNFVDGNKCGYLVDPANPSGIAGALKKIIANSALSERMGQLGRKAVLEKYNWDNENKVLQKLYARLT